MKRFQNIQNLALFFIVCFLLSGLAVIWLFQSQPLVVGAASVVCLGGLWFMVRSLLQLKGHLHAFHQKEARLTLLASRDPATGLFQHNGFEALLLKEIERAKRKDYTLTLMLIEVEPFEQISRDIGMQAMDRLLFQIGETLLGATRTYDGVFKLDRNTFALFYPETHVGELQGIVTRLKRRLEKTSFLVNTSRTKVTPRFKVGAALYPLDGTNPQSLESFARAHLTENFTTQKLRHPQKPDHDLYNTETPKTETEEVVAKPVEPEVSDEPQKTINLETLVKEVTEDNPHEQDVMLDEDDGDDLIIEVELESNATEPQTNSEDVNTEELQSELQSLFARADRLEENVKELMKDDGFVEPQSVRENKAQQEKEKTIEKFQPLPELKEQVPTRPQIVAVEDSQKIEELAQFAEVVEEPKPAPIETKPEPVIVAKPKKAPVIKPKAPEIENESAWSVEEIAEMPDIVAAMIQNEPPANKPKVERKKTTKDLTITNIEVVQKDNQPVIEVDFDN